MASPQPPTYTLTRKVLGHGGTSVVKMAYCDQTQFKVAIKVLNKSKMGRTAHSRLRTELEVMQHLELHAPGSRRFVRLLAAYETQTEIHIVMNYIRGIELFEYCNREECGVAEERARPIVKHLFQTVELLHELGIAHRDIKIDNIIIPPGSTGDAVLVDFGYSTFFKYEDEDGVEVKVMHKDCCGSLHYAAPELFHGAKYDSSKADVWALGVVLFCMLTGAFPFHGGEKDDDRVLTRCILENRIRYPPTMSKPAKCLIAWMLTSHPGHRPSMSEVLVHPWLDVSEKS